jgi:hypothetical protein
MRKDIQRIKERIEDAEDRDRLGKNLGVWREFEANIYIYIYIYIYYEGCDVIQYFLLRIYEKEHTKDKRG